ncbi:MAG: DUF4326 domain-containing protein [Alphaproteobacteria bacterium]|nr:DUF4326 domain-containing protein [Alphaproteobacteria bacterium]
MQILNIEESHELERCEVVIKQGLKTFIEVGEALFIIRDKRLYRNEFNTFEDYCQQKWHLGKRYVNQLIQASEVISNLGAMAPILPESERQVRPLTSLEPEIQKEVWKEVVEQSEETRQPITAARVQSVVNDWKPVNQEIKEVKNEPMFAISTPEELLKKAKEVAKERAEVKRQIIDQKGSTEVIPLEDLELINKMKNGETVVLNMNTNFHAMKWAKDNERFQQIDRWSDWGNPFLIGGDGNRDTVCESFKVYFNLKLELNQKVKQLKGKALGCHCYPLRCHGEHLKQLADEN